jgi:hypothetical protein
VAPSKSLQLQLMYRPSKPGALALEVPFTLQQASANTQGSPAAPSTPHDPTAASSSADWTGASVLVTCESQQPMLGLSDSCVDFGSVYVLRANQFKTPYQRAVTVTNLDAQQQLVRHGPFPPGVARCVCRTDADARSLTVRGCAAGALRHAPLQRRCNGRQPLPL